MTADELRDALVAAVRAEPGLRASEYSDRIGYQAYRRYTHLRLAVARARAAGRIAPSDPTQYGRLYPGAVAP
jgi:hypothetical protein